MPLPHPTAFADITAAALYVKGKPAGIIAPDLGFRDGGKQLPDVILLDLSMPKLSGWEFMQKLNVSGLREKATHPHGGHAVGL